ncbi:hypothetical protein E2C01_078812 [Portunus trituberculatus]|uniref:Uncharacterized protein n=1 Tax=Portunus trituberculatus TaxID=210409 RepID=A0A5B7IR77_PORTR|nr:hypothetical protein [Portunus trituberculatus]
MKASTSKGSSYLILICATTISAAHRFFNRSAVSPRLPVVVVRSRKSCDNCPEESVHCSTCPGEGRRATPFDSAALADGTRLHSLYSTRLVELPVATYNKTFEWFSNDDNYDDE